MAMIRRLLMVLLLLSQLFTGRVDAAGEGRFYRYTDDNGVMVISSKIPPRYESRGYDMITRGGRLIERIPPEPGPAEKARREQQRAEQERLQAWDGELLRRYSHPDDIEFAKQRKLTQVSNDTAIISRNIGKIDREIDRYQGLAAADERAGRTVSKATLDTIKALQGDRAKEQQKLAQKLAEQHNIVERFDRDIERFKVIRPVRVDRR